MFDRNSFLAGAATLLLGAVVGGAGFLYVSDSSSRAEPIPFTQAEKDSLAVALNELSERRLAQGQIEPATEPSVSQAERDFMNFTMPDLSEPRIAQTPAAPTTEPPVAQAERDFMDFTMPDLSKPRSGEDVTRHGCVQPEQPEWIDAMPPEEAQRVLLVKAIYNNFRYGKIVETNSCPCEIEHPSWDDADNRYHELTAGKSLSEIPEIRRVVSREVRKNLKASLDICKAWRGR